MTKISTTVAAMLLAASIVVLLPYGGVHGDSLSSVAARRAQAIEQARSALK